jgi:hypothetical protein
MRGTLPPRRSRLSDAARLAGALCVPVVVLALAGADAGLVDGRALRAALLLGGALAVLALALGACALAGIWVSGALGARSAALGILYASPVLAAIAAGAAALAIYPKLDDVSTDPIDPPRMAASASPEAAGHPTDRPDPAAQLIAYPDLAPRLYDRPLADVHAAAEAAVTERGWRLASAPPADVAGGIGTDGAEPGEASAEAATEAGAAESLIEASAPLPFLGFTGSVAIRMRETPDGTRLDMRSTLGGGGHDFGLNAKRIRSFLDDLDERLGAAPS